MGHFFASDLYLIYKLSPSARVCISDTDRLLMFYLVLNEVYHLIYCLSCILFHSTPLHSILFYSIIHHITHMPNKHILILMKYTNINEKTYVKIMKKPAKILENFIHSPNATIGNLNYISVF